MKIRKFRVASLAEIVPGARIALPENELHHIRVLRLEDGAEIQLADAQGRIARAKLEGQRACIISLETERAGAAGRKIMLATAWPKGKRAAWLVEKCTEIGADAIIPIRFLRSVVHKKEETEGVARLRRIAAEAAKQCGRAAVPEIEAEQSFEALLETAQTFSGYVFDPAGESDFLQALRGDEKNLPLLLVVGPEGGLTLDEVERAARAGMKRVRMAAHVLRVETAALMACALAHAACGTYKEDANRQE